jgi:FSR family fosmidomycin resistance protein-like MFS transporter
MTTSILFAISFCHLLNDLVQSLIYAVYPILKSAHHLDFRQIGLITLAYQVTASLLQPFVGDYTDRHPLPFSLAIGMGITLCGLLVLSRAAQFSTLLGGAALVGVGSSIFHPESSRVARLASGGRPGFAQSLFQVGGNTGTSLGPLLAAYIVLPNGQASLAWFSVVTLVGAAVLTGVGRWYRAHLAARPATASGYVEHGMEKNRVIGALAVLVALMFSKFFYLASLTSYYTFYLISKFHLSVASAEIRLFLFLGAAAAGTIVGGPVGDRIGRKYVIWASILGILPFTIILPYADLAWTTALTIVIGFVLASAMPAILVYAQDLVPGRVGLISGVFFGLAFGLGGIGAAVLGHLADATSLTLVYRVCSFLPAIGLLTVFLPQTHGGRAHRAAAPDLAPTSGALPQD